MDNKKTLGFAIFTVLGIIVISIGIFFWMNFNQKSNTKGKKEDTIITYVKDYCMAAYPVKEYDFKKEVLENGSFKVIVTKDGTEKFHYIINETDPICHQLGTTESIKDMGVGTESESKE